MSPSQEEREEREDSSVAQKDLGSILREQYEVTESFCNATTSLHNALLQDAPNLYQTTQEYQEALAKVQSNLRVLESMVIESPDVDSHHQAHHPSDAIPPSRTRQRQAHDNPLNKSLRAHVARTRRILTTIYSSGQGSSFHANGLPTTASSSSSSSLQLSSATSMQSSEGDSSTNATRLVALATLRASIQTVVETMSPS